ncbi:Integrase catalytic region [Cupriavidus basilensis OR16]|uniref:Integrase catalytic region n=1 Tax=Cupriavidus basilensis OR16 TaxID=1127483 RepID=H1S211_9BURK|nr:Integrase catalytic region [Cupriavidus basilensis OR16]
MSERGISVDHSTVHRWALKRLPALHKVLRYRKRPVGKCWRMDETYILVRAQRDKAAARRFFEKAVDHNGEPNSVTIDGSPANLAAPHDLNADRETPIAICQVKYLGRMQRPDGAAASAAQKFYSVAT